MGGNDDCRKQDNQPMVSEGMGHGQKKSPQLRGFNEYGAYLLFRLHADSTIGHEGLNFSVRDGKR
jgi:hypothetical protein